MWNRNAPFANEWYPLSPLLTPKPKGGYGRTAVGGFAQRFSPVFPIEWDLRLKFGRQWDVYASFGTQNG